MRIADRLESNAQPETALLLPNNIDDQQHIVICLAQFNIRYPAR